MKLTCNFAVFKIHEDSLRVSLNFHDGNPYTGETSFYWKCALGRNNRYYFFLNWNGSICDTIVWFNHTVQTFIQTAISWWHHQMETFSVLLVLPVTGEFPSRSPITRSIYVFSDLRLNKWLSKPSRRRWFDTPSPSLWRHCNVATLLQELLTWGYNSNIGRGGSNRTPAVVEGIPATQNITKVGNYWFDLTNWNWNKMADILQATYSNVYKEKQMVVSNCWFFLISVQFTLNHHWFWKHIGPVCTVPRIQVSDLDLCGNFWC